ncbi:hypothetical protein [Rhodanobacter umsongensis]
MTKLKNVPEHVPLDTESVFCLSVARAWVDVFPSTLRQYARVKFHNLYRSIWSKEISPYGLLSGAYIGFTPLPTSYGRFITHVERVNKVEPHAQSTEFRKDAVSRENSAAGEFGMSRGELKRLLERLDELAMKCAGIGSYDSTFNCKEEILQDSSPFAPADRETYAEGPLHLWDFAKAVNEHRLVEMSFSTCDDWVLFVHQEEGIIFGHAIHPRAHRFGNFSMNPLIDVFELQMRGGNCSPIIEVPQEVQEAVRSLADRRFPNQPFDFVPPPISGGGMVIPSKMIHPDHRRCWSGG